MKQVITSIKELDDAIIMAQLKQRVIVNSFHNHNEALYSGFGCVVSVQNILQKSITYLENHKKTKFLYFVILTYFNFNNNKVKCSDTFNFALNTILKKEKEKNSQLIQAILNVIMKRFTTYKERTKS